MQANPHVTPEKDRISVLEKLSFSAGALPYGFAYFTVTQMAYPVLNMTLGMSATLIGVMLAIGRLWDAVDDPLVGWISDNARTRWGRRLPFILLGAVMLAITLPLMWMFPSGLGQTGIFIWFTVTSVLFYTAGTFFSVPWLSLSYELTPDPQERTRIHAYRAYMGAFIGLLLPWLFAWAQSDVFTDVLSGVRWLSVGCGILCILFTLPIVLFCKERFADKALKQEKISIVRSVKETLSNKPFLIFECGIVSVAIGAPMLVGALGIYINTYYIFDGDMKAGASMSALATSVTVVIKLLTLPLTVKLCSLYGKVTVMRWSLGIGLVGAPLQYITYTPDYPYLQLVSAILLAPCVTAFWLLVDPMKADCADYDEWKTGLRREGSYASVANWIEKMSVTGVLFLSGFVLNITGYDPSLGADQSDETLWLMRVLYCVFPFLGTVVSLISLKFYSLSEERMQSIREELVKRRGSIN